MPNWCRPFLARPLPLLVVPVRSIQSLRLSHDLYPLRLFDRPIIELKCPKLSTLSLHFPHSLLLLDSTKQTTSLDELLPSLTDLQLTECVTALRPDHLKRLLASLLRLTISCVSSRSDFECPYKALEGLPTNLQHLTIHNVTFIDDTEDVTEGKMPLRCC